MIIRLLPWMPRARCMIFHEGDGTGGGGGGAAAVIDAPAPSGDPAGPDADLLSFSIPDIDHVGDVIGGTKEGDPIPPKAKQEPVPAKQEPAKPAVKTPPDEPASQLRKQLDSVKAERDELKGRLEKGDPRLVEVERAVKAKEAEIVERDKRIQEQEKQLAMTDPAVTAKVRELDTKYDRDATKFYNRVTELDANTVNSLAREYSKLPFGKDGYREARAAFEAKVNQKLGGTEDGPLHRKLDSTLDFIEQTFDFANERGNAMREAQQNAFKIRHESRISGYTNAVSRVRKDLEAARTVAEDADPFHPKVALKNLFAELGEEQTLKITKGIPEFAELVLAGPRPKGDEEYPGLTADQIAESRQYEQERYEKARTHAADIIYNGTAALRALPTLLKRLSKAESKLKEMGHLPPDPTGGNPDPAKSGDDVTKFEAPNLNSIDF